MATSVLGVFRYQDEFLAAVRKLRERGFKRLTTLSPIPLEEVPEILGAGRPPVRFFTFFGAITGAVCGFALATFSALAFITPTGGRPIIPFPPFLIISYEMTILFGVLATLAGFFIAARLPALRDRPHLPDVTVDRFSILVESENGDDLVRAAQVLRETGAEEVRYPGSPA